MDESNSQTMAPASSQPVVSNVSQLPAYAQAYIATPGILGSSRQVTNPNSPFYVRSNNHEKFKYKYPEAAPTPDDEDDYLWNKTYTAADSRHYNHHGKSPAESKKYRQNKETYTLALSMLNDYKTKYAEAVRLAVAAGENIPTAIPRGNPKAVIGKAEASGPPKKVNSSTSGQEINGQEFSSLSISEKIKADSRARKPSALALSNNSTAQIPTMPNKKKTDGSALPKKNEKKRENSDPDASGGLKKQKKMANVPSNDIPSRSMSVADSARSVEYEDEDQESTKGQELHCHCQKPDRQEIMVQCEKGCGRWFHYDCINMTLDEAESLIDIYVCKDCSTETDGPLFKRVCRFTNIHKVDPTVRNCRNPALVLGDSAAGKKPSKYCSEKCCEDFWDWVKLKCLRQDGEPSRGGVLNVAEFEALVEASGGDIHVFRRFGKKPRLPRDPSNPERHPGMDHLNDEQKERLRELDVKETKIRHDRDLWEKYHEFLDMILNRGELAAAHLGFKSGAEMCGWDSRVTMMLPEFEFWMSSPEGIRVFEDGVIGAPDELALKIVTFKPIPGTVPVVSPPLDPILQNLCLHRVDKHKASKNCMHMKSGPWENNIFDHIELQYRQLGAAEDKIAQDRLDIYDQAEEEFVMKPYWNRNKTYRFDLNNAEWYDQEGNQVEFGNVFANALAHQQFGYNLSDVLMGMPSRPRVPRV